MRTSSFDKKRRGGTLLDERTANRERELEEIQFYCRIRHSKEHIQSLVNVC